MGRPDVHVVWFKRDLRVHDHAALTAAVETSAPVLPLYVLEPSLLAHPHTSPRHVELILDGLADLRESLAALGAPLVVRVGEVVDILEDLSTQVAVDSVHSHEEFGVLATWERDRAVADWCRARGVRYREHRQSGAMRGLASRDTWSRQRMALFSRPLHRVPAAIRPTDVAPGPMPTLRDLGLIPEDMTYRQRGGEHAGREVMRSWLTVRVPGYEKKLSSPVSGWAGCSRLSVHLALGTVSAREVHARVQARKGEPGSPRFSLTAFEERLAWRDHFTQKLEDAPFIEQGLGRSIPANLLANGGDTPLRLHDGGGVIDDRIRVAVALLARHKPWGRQQAVWYVAQFGNPSPHELTRGVVVELLLHRIVDPQFIHPRDTGLHL